MGTGSAPNQLKVKKKLLNGKAAEYAWAYFFIAPVLLGLTVFYIIPFVQNIWYSFCDVNRFNQSTFAGLANFKEMFSTGEIFRATANTFIYVILVVPLSVALAIFVAALLNQKIRGQGAYRVLYYLPAITMQAAVAMVWKWMYNGNYGILNQILGVFGIEGQNWLSEPGVALFAVSLVGVWNTVGYNMVILLAGMQGISKSYYEAAAIDGASGIKQFFKITVPMLTPSIFFVMVTGLISAFQVFDVIYMMIDKTSMAFESTQTLIMLFYRNAFDYGRKGYAAAISLFVFLIIMVVTVIQMKMQKKWVNYD